MAYRKLFTLILLSVSLYSCKVTKVNKDVGKIYLTQDSIIQILKLNTTFSFPLLIEKGDLRRQLR